jgi:hypothetical protein
MRLKPVFIPITQLDLSLAECFLEGSGINYIVHNRNTFSTLAFPPISSYSDCSVYVSPDDYEDASVILSELLYPTQPARPIQYKLRLILETWLFGQFVQTRRSIQTAEVIETEA